MNTTPDCTDVNADVMTVLGKAPENCQIKSASDNASGVLKTYLTENGFARNICPISVPTEAQLQESVGTEFYHLIDHKTPGSPGAGVIGMNEAPDLYIFSGDKFRVDFFDISTMEYTKNLRHLATYRQDLRAYMTDQGMREIQTTEDSVWLTLTATCYAGSTFNWESGGGANAYGKQRDVTFTGGVTVDNYVNLSTLFHNDKLPLGVVLLNQTTWAQIAKLPATSVGHEPASTFFREGIGALKDGKAFGLNHIITMKSDLVPTGTALLYAEPNYLGRFYVLEEPTMYVEKKRDQIFFSARETIGMAIANENAVRRVSFGDNDFFNPYRQDAVVTESYA